jgi:cytochrome c-type biogenesis protein
VSTSIFFGGSVVAAIVAGSIALFAPCCISVMLPAYFASSFQNRRALVAMTFVFGAGVATIVLPIAMGAAVFRSLFSAHHITVYLVGGLLMLTLAAYTLAGGQIRMPTPSRGASRRKGPLSIYTLGVFSGIATSCCAPVLAGVIALSGAASSFLVALGYGTAYVFGMVAPLFVISLLWDRYDWRASRLFRPRSYTWRAGKVHRTISGSNLASGVLLTLMGSAAVWLAFSGNSMPSPTGWQAHLTARLQHYGHNVSKALAWVPSWLAGGIVVLAIAPLGLRATRQLRGKRRTSPSAEQEAHEVEHV